MAKDKSASSIQQLPGNKKNKTPFYFYIVLFSIPILFFLLFEFSLRIFNYGQDLSMWTSWGNGKLVLNPNVAKRYFSNLNTLPTSVEDVFDSTKSQNAFRVFVLGESSAAGYPFMPLGAFSKYIYKRLEIEYPDKKIEVINLGLTAVNSYTLRDFTPAVLEQSPDLIIIYTGHNEYYGALGIGSNESVGSSRFLVNAYLYLSKFKTVQLLKDFIQWSAGLFSSSNQKQSAGTLMSKMAKEQSIPFNSNSYKMGLEQFRENLSDIIEWTKNANVPILLSTLTSNLKDQPPFVSISKNKELSAKLIFEQAKIAFNNQDYNSAKELFYKAKDLDELRFRAPSEINRIIKSLSNRYSLPLVDIDSLFNSISPNGIVGNNLMTDHLHPTIEGYREMGKAFYHAMTRFNYLPKGNATLPYSSNQSVMELIKLTAADSIAADMRIKLLKNSYPFVQVQNETNPFTNYIPKNFEDSLAFDFFILKKIDWIQMHIKGAEHYLMSNRINEFKNHVNSVLLYNPYLQSFRSEAAEKLIDKQLFSEALPYLLDMYKFEPDEFSTKWIGAILFSQSRFAEAEKYLSQSVNITPNDPQTLYNLAATYYKLGKFSLAMAAIKNSLRLRPNYPMARQLYQILLSANNN